MKLSLDISKNNLLCGDCCNEKSGKGWLNSIPDKSVDLIYIDPPFFSNKNYEIVWGNSYEVSSFGDRFAGGIHHYIKWMEPKIKEAERVLKDTGAIFLHCDWHASHRLRCLLDDIFGEKNFVNEIIYKAAPKKNDRNKNKLSSQHNTLFLYSKKKKITLNPYVQHDDSYIKKTYKCEDDKGLYSSNPLSCKTKQGGYAKQKEFEFEGVTKRWMYSLKTLEKYKKEGRLIKTKTGIRKKVWLSESKGKTLSDLWTDIPFIGRQEKIDYPTQKPEALIERILKCASREKDLVMDFFVGGGTTAKVCADLNRRFIVGDVSPVAVRVTADRLVSHGYMNYEVKGLPSTKKDYLKMNPHKFADMICEIKGWKPNRKKSGDRGIDGFADNGNIPIQIKNHKSKTGRPDIQKFLGAINKYEKGFFVSWDFSSEANEFKASIKDKQIELLKVKYLLNGLLIPDEISKKHKRLYDERVNKAFEKEAVKATPAEAEKRKTQTQKTKEKALESELQEAEKESQKDRKKTIRKKRRADDFSS